MNTAEQWLQSRRCCLCMACWQLLRIFHRWHNHNVHAVYSPYVHLQTYSHGPYPKRKQCEVANHWCSKKVWQWSPVLIFWPLACAVTACSRYVLNTKKKMKCSALFCVTLYRSSRTFLDLEEKIWLWPWLWRSLAWTWLWPWKCRPRTHRCLVH